MTDAKSKQVDSHTARRIKFGLNVTVAVAAAVGLAVLVNWIAARQYVRADLTRGGSYSLSAQSRAVLAKLGEGYRLVTLIPDESRAPDEETALVWRRVRDMTDEYARFADGLTTEHINPRTDVSRATRLNKQIEAVFADELKPVREAIDQGRSAMQAVDPINARLIAVLTTGVNAESGDPDRKAGRLFEAALSRCMQFQTATRQAKQQAEELRNQVIVNYAGIKEQYEGVLKDYDTVLGVIIQSADQLVRSADTANADKERLLEVVDLCKKARAALAEPLETMSAAEGSPKYNQAIYDLSTGASVVALGPGKLKVVPVSEMWRQDARDYEQTGQVRQQYLIEEKLTGALLSMTLEQPPMVVFVLSGSGTAMGPQGSYNIVAQRLENADFRVEQWNPAGQMTAMGQPMPPAPPPQPQPGQKTVWIVLPTPSNQMNPMMMASNPSEQIADLLRQRLDAGDSAMVLLAPDPNANLGMTNPVLDVLSDWGLTAQTDRVVMEEVATSNRRTQTSLQFMIDTWPDTLPITSALNGMQAVFQIASPIIVGKAEGVRHVPLVELKGERLWTHSDLTSPQSVRNARYDESQSAPSFTIAVASEKDGTRLVTVAEQVWATDDMTGMGLLGPGTAELTGAVVPGNAELFVNSVFWLSGLEDLIAASPRSQDVPRVRPMTAEQLWWHQVILLTGMPGAALVLGLGVWWVRRQA